MTKVVNDTDKLTYILTNYGLARVAEALADTTVNIVLTKMKLGDANYEYYEPEAGSTELVHPIEGAEYPILAKELLEDGLTVSLHSVFPERLDNCEIREVGIYETVNGEDKLFARSTQQPLIKPSTELNYFTTVDYYAFLKSQNLSDIYDQIVLDPDDQLVTEEDLENLMKTIAFTESNLMEQINGNSRVIGLNRAQQLKAKIEANRDAFGYTSAYNTYSLLLNAINSDDIFGYWLFNYPRRTTSTSSVTDISPRRRNLSTNKPINVYERIYDGITPTLKFNAPNYFYLDQGEGVIGYDENAFTIVGNPVVNSIGVASDFSENDYLKGIDMTVTSGDTGALYFNFSVSNRDNDQSIFYTAEPYTFNSFFSSDASELMVQLGDGTQWLTTLFIPVTLGREYTIRVLFNNEGAYLGVLENGVYVEKTGALFTNPVATEFGEMIVGAPHDSYEAFSGSIDLKAIALRVNGVQIFSGSKYSADNDMSFITEDRTADTPFSMIFAVEPLGTEDRTLIARSNYATNTNVFEITETAEGTLRVKLFTDSSNYATFESAVKMVPNKPHAVAFSYDPLNRTMTAFVGGKKVRMNRTVTGNYTHMNDATATLYAFTYTENGTIWANSATVPTELLNADGTPYTGTEWELSDGTVFFGEFVSTYEESKNEETDKLYAWNYNDGLDDHTIYTKTETLEADTIMYNANYTQYIGTAFTLVLSGSDYIIQYNSNTTEYTEEMNIEPQTLYAYYYEGNMNTVWANDSSIPSILYDANGDLYTGTDFTLNNNIIYYKDGGEATYNSLFNILIPALPVTSYVTGVNGEPEKYINSNIGVVVVIKAGMTEEQLRSFSLNIEAALGNNPCITI